jgi:hypothetical protein
MSLRSFILLMILGTVLACMAWIIILFSVDPRDAGIPGFTMFYLTLGAALTGMALLALTFVRLIILKRRDVPVREIRIAFRHALLFSFVAVGSLALSAHGWLRTWHVIVLIAIASIAETIWAQAMHERR